MLLNSSMIIKEENKKRNMGEPLVAARKVRIVYSDPDATDSESDYDNEIRIRRKRVVHEIVISTNTKESWPDMYNSNNKSSSMFKGVRKRLGGKFASEIRDPFTKKRVWLGTFDSQEMAAKAYQEKKLEFERLFLSEKNKNNTSLSIERTASETTNHLYLPALSPSSVLEITDSPPCDDRHNSACLKEVTEIESNVEERSFFEILAAELLDSSSSDIVSSCEDDLIYFPDATVQSSLELVHDLEWHHHTIVGKDKVGQ